VSRRLYQREASPECRTIRWVLERKRLEYQPIEVEASIAADLRRRYDTDDVPLLEDDAHVVAGTRPIAFYLERTYRSPSILPPDPQKRNQAVTLAEFAEQAMGGLTARLLQAGARRDDLVTELRARLGYVREAIGRRALDSSARHLGDIAVAAHLVTCRDVAELEFDRDYADLAAYVARVRTLAPGEAESL
jgi:glutathione S-transferase